MKLPMQELANALNHIDNLVNEFTTYRNDSILPERVLEFKKSMRLHGFMLDEIISSKHVYHIKFYHCRRCYPAVIKFTDKINMYIESVKIKEIPINLTKEYADTTIHSIAKQLADRVFTNDEEREEFFNEINTTGIVVSY